MTEPIKVYTHDDSCEPLKFWDNYTDHLMNRDHVMRSYGYDLWWKTIESDLKQEYNCNLILLSGKTPQLLEFQNNDDYVKFMLRWS